MKVAAKPQLSLALAVKRAANTSGSAAGISATIPKLDRSTGFTLIEILIAIAILSIMGVFIFTVTTRSFQVNFSLGQESTDYVATTLTIQALESDLSQLYSPVLPEKALGPNTGNEQAAPTQPQSSTENQPKEFWSAPARKDGTRRTRFVGSAEKVSFVANNNRRVEENSTQSDFQKIIWQVERNSEGTYSLYRTTDWDAFELENKSKTPGRVALLENMTSAKFRYYRHASKTWEDTWDSESPYILPQDRFPDLISLRFETPDPMNNALSLTWEVNVKPNLRLNADRPKTSSTSTPAEVPDAAR